MYVKERDYNSCDSTEPASMGFGQLNFDNHEGSMEFYTNTEKKIEGLTPQIFATADRIEDIHKWINRAFKASVFLFAIALLFGMMEDLAIAMVISSLLGGIATALIFTLDSLAMKFLDSLKLLLGQKSYEISGCNTSGHNIDLESFVMEVAEWIGSQEPTLKDGTWSQKWIEAKVLVHNSRFAVVAVNHFQAHRIDLRLVVDDDDDD